MEGTINRAIFKKIAKIHGAFQIYTNKWCKKLKKKYNFYYMAKNLLIPFINFRFLSVFLCTYFNISIS